MGFRFTIPALMLSFASLFCQDFPAEKKQLKALRTSEKIEIDGRLDEKAWQGAQSSSNWYTYSPTYGQPCPFNTDVAILYDNDAIYIGAWLNDPNPDSIMKEIAVRDYSMTKSEVFLVWLNPYNDGQNMLQFEASIANVQKDGKVTNNSTDLNWNAIYQTGTSIDDKGWYVEMRIPMKSIYFPDKKIQEWGINFLRWVPRKMANYCWNPMDRTKVDIGTQAGILTGLENLKQPLRLNLFPYVSGNVQRTPSGNSYAYSAGMDLQYGINESFTLDMTLIPDFGQRKSDYQVLNLTPFEVHYDENRQFFLSGFEMFKKSNLFYSRRVGKKPGLFDSVNDSAAEAGGKVLSNPMDSRLINAFKVSGRTGDGLGLGIFNAVTANTYATIEDSSGKKRSILTEAGKNYNMMVFDKILGKYSYLNMINLNSYEFKSSKASNVTGSAFKFSDSKNTYMIYGTSAVSLKHNPGKSPDAGYMMNLTGGKGSGKAVFLYNFGMYSGHYNPNDMGYLARNNIIWQQFIQRYTNFSPRKFFINWNSSFNFVHRMLYSNLAYYNTEYTYTFQGTFNNYSIFQFGLSGLPFAMHDQFEPRVEGRYSYFPSYYGGDISYTTDTRENIYSYLTLGTWMHEGKYYYIGCGSVMKITDRFSLKPSLVIDLAYNNRGFAEKINNDTVIYGFRTIKTTTLIINGTYVFNNKNFITLSIRDYRSTVDYSSYKFLNPDGSLGEAPFYHGNKDVNFNTVNVDFLYSWNFAPGSFLTIGWKNGIYLDDPVENKQFYSYFRNLNYVIGQPQTNILSFKLTYYLDYVYLRAFRKTPSSPSLSERGPG